MFGVHDIEINVKWLDDIPFLFEKQNINFIDVTITEMFNKYKFNENYYK